MFLSQENMTLVWTRDDRGEQQGQGHNGVTWKSVQLRKNVERRKVFRGVIPCGLVELYGRFGRTYWRRYEYKTTRRHNPEDRSDFEFCN
jgi:hypothetical protein